MDYERAMSRLKRYYNQPENQDYPKIYPIIINWGTYRIFEKSITLPDYHDGFLTHISVKKDIDTKIKVSIIHHSGMYPIFEELDSSLIVQNDGKLTYNYIPIDLACIFRETVLLSVKLVQGGRENTELALWFKLRKRIGRG